MSTKHFTPVEKSILRLLPLQNKDIAARLRMKKATVERNIEKMLIRTNCETRTQLVVRAIAEQTMKPEDFEITDKVPDWQEKILEALECEAVVVLEELRERLKMTSEEFDTAIEPLLGKRIIKHPERLEIVRSEFRSVSLPAPAERLHGRCYVNRASWLGVAESRITP